MSYLSRFLLVAAVAVLAACGSSSAPTGSSGQGTQPHDGGEPPDAMGPRDDTGLPPVEDGPSCAAVVTAHPIEGNLHMPVCSPLVYGTNPPSSGDHYPIWAAYRTYTKPFLPGFWVHSLEHGTVVISYNCSDGCPSDVARIQAFIDALPADCAGPPRRIILLPNPQLDVRFAASAWGFTLKSECFDRAAFAEFVAAHYNHAPEAICANGLDPLTAGTGGTPLCP
jgi:hypothetical protein